MGVEPGLWKLSLSPATVAGKLMGFISPATMVCISTVLLADEKVKFSCPGETVSLPVVRMVTRQL